MNIIAIIPARGGSKGIPRKNLRLMYNKPLIYYAIKNALGSKYNLDVYVSSEDDEILNTAQLFGAKIRKREQHISKDATTLDPVIYDCYNYAENIENKKYDLIITLQPTSPLLKAKTLDLAIERIISNYSIDTIISAKDNTHLSWRKENEKYIPNYKERLNRQYLKPIYTETGGFVITRKNTLTQNNRIGNIVKLSILENSEAIDIDSFEDWNLCEYYLKRKHILFVVTGNNKVGLGHVYNTLLIANDILNHKISFIVDNESDLAYMKIKSKNYTVFKQKSENFIDDISNLNPDIIINDKLDNSSEYIRELKKLSVKIVNFEDLGVGAEQADLVINAIYPENKLLPNHYFGQNYFLLRDEFIFSEQKNEISVVKNILITFGGVDPNNYTKTIIEIIYEYCQKNNIDISVITGFGYNKYESLKEFKKIRIHKNVSNIAQHMLKADLIFTSAGRTVYEIASIGTPAIVLAQNERELSHFFASSEFGFLNLGLGYNLSKIELYENFLELVNSKELRAHMSTLMKRIELNSSRSNVIKLIKNVIEEV